MKKRKSLLIVLSATAALAFLTAGCRSGAAENETSAPENTSEAPAETSSAIQFEAVTTDGESVTSDIFADSSLTMVNVWATYCNPCLMEMPDLGELAAEYPAEDFQIVGIVSDVPEGDEDALASAISLIEETEADYTHLLLNESLYTAMLTDVSVVPTTFFVDSEGKILDTVTGSKEKDTWKELIDAHLEAQN